MTVADRLRRALTLAMRQRQPERAAALRLLIAAVNNRQIELRRPPDDRETIQLLQSERKKREEALTIYRQAGREELAAQEEAELMVIGEFLPREFSRDEVEGLVGRLKTAGELPADFGAAMKLVLAKTAGRADGRTVAEAVKAAL